MVTLPATLWSFGQEVHVPATERGGQGRGVWWLTCRDDAFKSRAVIYDQLPDICVFMTLVGQVNVQGIGNGIVCQEP